MSARGPRVDASESRAFLEAMFADKPDHLYILLWTISDKKSHWFRNIEHAIRFAESKREHDLYVGVGLSRKDYGPSHRCLSNEIVGIVGVWSDIDLKSDAHSTNALPATIEDALKVLPEHLPPSFVVRTGNGVHAWWFFREPLIFESEEEQQAGAVLATRWQSLIRRSGAARGWALDRLGDLARVLRVPGTQNSKDVANRKAVEIYRQTDCRYNPSELADYLDDVGIPASEDQERNALRWKENSGDTPLIIDLSAAVPEAILERYLREDPRFYKTWHGQRDDLKDSSPSGYDMALANFAAGAGLSGQQAVNLIIHHRRIHGQTPRTKLDYFQRTIANAYKHCLSFGVMKPTATSAPDRDQAIEHTEVDPDTGEPDSARDRAVLCDQISSALGVRIIKILKTTGKEPTYQLQLETGKVELASVSKLLDQKSFRTVIASAANHIIPKFKTYEWDQIAQAMLDALTVEDGGEETDFIGSVRLYLGEYLSASSFIDSIEEEPLTDLSETGPHKWQNRHLRE